MSDDRFRPKVSFLSRDVITCPVCGHEFYQERLHKGGGRQIAGAITDTLHRLYKPSQKYGKITPLAYIMLVCPDCFYCAYPADFMKIDEEAAGKLKDKTMERIDFANKLVDGLVDFTKFRNLQNGAVSYALAVDCYDYIGRKKLPVIKQAICSMRAAYLFEELEEEKPGNNYQFVAELFYRKALYFYKRAQYLNIEKEQIMENMKPLGPDTDKDYGFDGINFLIALLTFKYGKKDDPEKRLVELEEAKILMGKLFGMGKSNFDKPKEILERSRDFYELIGNEIKDLNG
jgi:uncharacterized protein (DUF2225 family)